MTETKAGVRPVGAKVSAPAADTQTGSGNKTNEQSATSQGAEKSARTRPARRTASSSQTEVRDNRPRKPDRKPGQVKVAPATVAASSRKRAKRTAAVRRRAQVTAAAPQKTELRPETITNELRLKAMMQEHVPSPQPTDTSAADVILEGAVDSLRRLLSELIEQRMETVVRELAEVRSEAASASSDGAARVVDRLDQMLESLGAVKFAAPRFDALDPLIHGVLEERHEAGIPDGVILATIRPGFRTGRGLVLCKAAVAVNRGE